MEPVAWAPGQPIEGRTSLQGVLGALSFGRNDAGYNALGKRLAERGCLTVDQLIDDWTQGEFVAMGRSCVPPLAKKPRVYLAVIEATIKRSLQLAAWEVLLPSPSRH